MGFGLRPREAGLAPRFALQGSAELGVGLPLVVEVDCVCCIETVLESEGVLENWLGGGKPWALDIPTKPVTSVPTVAAIIVVVEGRASEDMVG